MTNRWSHTDAPRGAAYDSRWDSLAAQGIAVHGEADCCEWLCDEFSLPRRVLDAGCGTGRVGLELAQRGFTVVGVDADESMLATARIKAAGQQRSIGVSGTSEWLLADLATWQQPDEAQPFGLAVKKSATLSDKNALFAEVP